jgi:modulator of FtsH protease HflC
MNKPLTIGIGLLLLICLVLFSMTYSVSFHEVAIRQTFGQATDDSVVTEPGLHFKLPIFADQITKYDTRLQLLETALDTIPTADGQQVVIKAYLLWQIDTNEGGPRRFDTSYRTLEAAANAIDDQFRTAVAAGISRYNFDDLIGSQSRLPDAERAILAQLESLRDTGIVPRTVGISQVLLPPRVTRNVLERMKATREILGRAERFKGDAEAERIESEARTMADKIRAFAELRAEEIRAAGNEEAARYIAQMAEDVELATFLVHLQALDRALSEHTTVVLPTAFSPWHLMDIGTRVDARGLPQAPAEAYVTLPDGRVVPAHRPLAQARDANPNPSEESKRDTDESGSIDRSNESPEQE